MVVFFISILLVFLMIFSWNCRGCSSFKFIATCRQFVVSYKSKILILLETWIAGTKVDQAIRRLCFYFNIRQEAKGFSGGIWLLWNDESVKIDVLISHK